MIEIVLAIVGILGILGMAGFSFALAFWILPGLKKMADDKKYSVIVPGWDVRLTEVPFFQNTLEDVGQALNCFFNRAVDVKNYNRDDLRTRLNQLKIQFVRHQNDTNERYIVDAYGRKIAGDHSGDEIRVVALESDTLNQTAFFHELGHAVHHLEKETDYDHSDEQMWSEIVVWCKKNCKG